MPGKARVQQQYKQQLQYSKEEREGFVFPQENQAVPEVFIEDGPHSHKGQHVHNMSVATHDVVRRASHRVRPSRLICSGTDVAVVGTRRTEEDTLMKCACIGAAWSLLSRDWEEQGENWTWSWLGLPRLKTRTLPFPSRQTTLIFLLQVKPRMALYPNPMYPL
ncbi:hypothetical protein C8R45DRAFT_926646 [Mycena sanguinolenta]|nr:hypothetical protein C8R45DRAFT_926646 [Mycena sanguinolenta]